MSKKAGMIVTIFEYALVALVSGALTLHIVRVRMKPFSSVMDAKAEVYEQIDTVMRTTPVQRFLIFSTSNGGGKPNVGTPVYSTAIFERVVYPFEPHMAEFTRVPLDEHYLSLLRECRGGRFVILETARLPLDCMIEGIYKECKVAAAMWFFLHETDSHLFYASIATDENYHHELINQAHFWKYEKAMKEIARIFKRHHSMKIFLT
jgi:hypothetical protein